MPYADNKGADQISTFAVRCLDSIIPILALSKISGLQLVSVSASYLVGNPEDRFSRDGTKIIDPTVHLRIL